jgi:acetyl-CoA synthetase
LAGFFQNLGVKKGDQVAVLLPKSEELMVSALSIWRLGASYIPLFTAFGPQGIEYRLQAGEASGIETDETNRPKLDEISEQSRAVLQIITVFKDKANTSSTDHSFWKSLNQADPVTKPTVVSGDDMMILLFTSGTTGNPKGVPIPVKCLASFEAYMRFGLDVRSDDVFWNMADPGWAYGLYDNLLGPLLLGKTVHFYGGAFSPEDVYKIMHKWQVTNFASAPTAYRSP